MARRPYAPHDALVAPARARNQLWRLLVGLAVIALVAMGLNTSFYVALRSLIPPELADELGPGIAEGNTALSLIILLSTFGFITIGVLAAANLVQRRAPLGVIGPLPLALSQFLRVVRNLVIVGVVLALLPPYDMGDPLEQNLPAGRWLMLLPISLLVVLIQTSSEEILFRGYIQQGLAARFSNPLIWMIVPSLLFALGHYIPAQAGDNAVIIALWAGLFGVLMADLTARAGTLGPAMAVHMMNNVTALLIVSLPDTLSGLALFTLPYAMSDTEALRSWLAVDFAVMFVSWLAARLAIRR